MEASPSTTGTGPRTPYFAPGDSFGSPGPTKARSGGGERSCPPTASTSGASSRTASAKQPYYTERRDGEPIALAGLWEEWRGSDRKASRRVRARSSPPPATRPSLPIHDRRPVILLPSAWDAWLDPTYDDVAALGKLLVPAQTELLTVHPVSTAVNSVRNDGPDLIVEATGDQLVS